MMFIPPFPPKLPNKPNNTPTLEEFTRSVIAYCVFSLFAIIGGAGCSIVIKHIAPIGTVVHSVMYLLGYTIVTYGGMDFVTAIKMFANRYTYSMIFLANNLMCLLFTIFVGYSDYFGRSIILALVFVIGNFIIQFLCVIINVKINNRENWFYDRTKK